MEIRRSRADDEPFLRELSRTAFGIYGPYEKWIPEWADYPGVLTYVGERDACRAGFHMLTFYREAPLVYVGDLVAIAVQPDQQGAGLGSELLFHAQHLTQRLGAVALTLSVADTNHAAQRLFARHGFRPVEGEFGTYECGQKTVKMRLDQLGR